LHHEVGDVAAAGVLAAAVTAAVIGLIVFIPKAVARLSAFTLAF